MWLHASLTAEVKGRAPVMATSAAVVTARPTPTAPKQSALLKPNAKKGQAERVYAKEGPEQIRAMLDRVIQGEAACKVAADAGYPSAQRTLYRLAKNIRQNLSLRRDTTEETVAAQRAHVAELKLVDKGHVDLVSCTLFSEDELEYEARALKLYAELGWPMDYAAVQYMLSQAARGKGAMNWKKETLGSNYLVSKSYAKNFVKSRPELHAYKFGHIDPIRAKKATSQVRRGPVSILNTRTQFSNCPITPTLIARIIYFF